MILVKISEMILVKILMMLLGIISKNRGMDEKDATGDNLKNDFGEEDNLTFGVECFNFNENNMNKFLWRML